MFPQSIYDETAILRRRFSLIPRRKNSQEDKTVVEHSADDSDDTLVEDSDLNRTFVAATAFLDSISAEDSLVCEQDVKG